MCVARSLHKLSPWDVVYRLFVRRAVPWQQALGGGFLLRWLCFVGSHSRGCFSPAGPGSATMDLKAIVRVYLALHIVRDGGLIRKFVLFFSSSLVNCSETRYFVRKGRDHFYTKKRASM